MACGDRRPLTARSTAPRDGPAWRSPEDSARARPVERCRQNPADRRLRHRGRGRGLVADGDRAALGDPRPHRRSRRPRRPRCRTGRPSLASGPTESPTTAGAISSDTRFITLISGLIAGPAVSLNGSPTVSPMTVAAWAVGALAAVVAVLDELLGVVPRATGVGQEHRHQGAGADGAGQEAGQRRRRRGRSRRRSGPGRPADRAWPARAASPGCRCRRPCRTPASRCRP